MVIVLVAIVVNFAYRIDLKDRRNKLIGELAYFPSGLALRALSLGLYAPLADVVWLRFIQYYGEHRMTDAKFELMYNILDILTTLDQRFLFAYTLGSLMLTHDAQRPDHALKLLRKGISANPDGWEYPFLYGFINYVFLKEYRVAVQFFRLAAYKPGASDMAKRWAAFVLKVKVHDLRASLALWADLYDKTTNLEEKSTAEYYIKKITMEIHIQDLDLGINAFYKNRGRYPASLRELKNAGIIEAIPEEPHGGYYFIRDGKAQSSWKKPIR